MCGRPRRIPWVHSLLHFIGRDFRNILVFGARRGRSFEWTPHHNLWSFWGGLGLNDRGAADLAEELQTLDDPSRVGRHRHFTWCAQSLRSTQQRALTLSLFNTVWDLEMHLVE